MRDTWNSKINPTYDGLNKNKPEPSFRSKRRRITSSSSSSTPTHGMAALNLRTPPISNDQNDINRLLKETIDAKDTLLNKMRSKLATKTATRARKKINFDRHSKTNSFFLPTSPQVLKPLRPYSLQDQDPQVNCAFD